MELTAGVVSNAVASDIVGRIFSRVFDNFLSSRGHARDAHRQRLEWLLLDITSKVEEAEGRHITNLSLLGQLKAVTNALYRGRFTLEVDDADADAAAVETTTGKRKRKLAALCLPLNAVKRAHLIVGGGTEKRLADVVEELEFLTGYMGSFIEMVKEYPRRPRQLTTTLFMDRRVFGRHVETERIVAFLLQPAPRSTGLSALAVVGDRGVGKTTLVKHACHDERLRGHFAHVEWLDWADVVNAGWTGDGPEYLAGMRRILDKPRFRAAGRSLLVFDHSICWPIDKSAWVALLATSKLAEVSKLLFTGKNADLGWIVGTVEPVVLWPLPEEEFWYYFKGLALGGTDLQEHQHTAAVGREISRNLGSRFLDARVLGDLLRANLDARFWRQVLAAVVKRKGNRIPVYDNVLGDLLSIKGWMLSYGCGEIDIPPKTKLTLHDVLRAAATSSSAVSGLGGGDAEEAFTIHCSQGLYKNHLYSIVLKKVG